MAERNLRAQPRRVGVGVGTARVRLGCGARPANDQWRIPCAGALRHNLIQRSSGVPLGDHAVSGTARRQEGMFTPHVC